MTKIAMTIALAVALSACAGNGQPGNGGPPSVGTSGTTRDAVDNGGSTSSTTEQQKTGQARRNTTPPDYFPADPPVGYGPAYGSAYGPAYGQRYGYGSVPGRTGMSGW